MAAAYITNLKGETVPVQRNAARPCEKVILAFCNGFGLASIPPVNYWRLTRIFNYLVPYRSDETIERGVRVTREVLRSTIELARAHGAVPIIIVPQFTPEESQEQEIRKRVLDEAGLPYIWVQLDQSWHVPGDPHPDDRAAHAGRGRHCG